MKFKIYIIYSAALDKYYVGHTNDLNRRLIEHNTGQTRFTQTGKPWELKHTEDFLNRAEAMKREKQIKGMKSRKYIEQLVRASRS